MLWFDLASALLILNWGSNLLFSPFLQSYIKLLMMDSLESKVSWIKHHS